MIQYPGFRFASPPRTGTAWFVQACAIGGLGSKTRGTVHIPHDENASDIRVSIARHPCNWLLSYYVNIHRGYVGVTEVDVFMPLRADKFHLFVEDYLRTCPGAIGRMFTAYNASRWMRLEDMPFAFCAFLEVLRPKMTKKDREAIFKHASANKTRIVKPVWPAQLWEEVMKAEREHCETFEYFE